MEQIERLSIACAVLALTSGIAFAQEDVLIPAPPTLFSAEPLGEPEDVLVARIEPESQDAGEAGENEYWLGVQVTGVPELAKKQLGIEHGLAVGDVVADSPAAKADIRKFDILTKANDAQLADLDDLVKAVEASEGQEITITILREGKRQTAKVTATKRPPGTRISVVAKPEIAEEIRRVEEALQKLKSKTGDRGLNFYIPRPGVVAPRAEVNRAWSAFFGEQTTKADFPKNLSIRVTKEGDQPAKINVKRDDKEWDVTEDKLNELPDDIRPYVERYVGQGMAQYFRTPAAAWKHDRTLRVTPEGKVEGEIRVRPVPPVPPTPPAAPMPPARPRGASPAAPDQSYRIVPGPVEMHRLDAIHQELRELRKEVEELRKARKD